MGVANDSATVGVSGKAAHWQSSMFKVGLLMLHSGVIGKNRSGGEGSPRASWENAMSSKRRLKTVSRSSPRTDRKTRGTFQFDNKKSSN
eukprot:5825779-Amphidinium_carterae.1